MQGKNHYPVFFQESVVCSGRIYTHYLSISKILALSPHRPFCFEGNITMPSQSFTFMIHIIFYLVSRILRSQSSEISEKKKLNKQYLSQPEL